MSNILNPNCNCLNNFSTKEEYMESFKNDDNVDNCFECGAFKCENGVYHCKKFEDN